MKLSDFISVFVAALYNETELSDRTEFRLGEILDKYGLELKPSWQEAIFKDYTFDRLVDSRRHLGPTRQQRVSLSAEGWRWVEDELGENVASFLEQHGASYSDDNSAQLQTDARPSASTTPHSVSIEIPASDRVVSVDHNSKIVKEIREATDSLVQKIRFGNDLGDMSAEEAEAAANEVYQLGLFFEAETVRQNTVLTLAKTVLPWIADKAGGAVVGLAAIALLGLIASFFGLSVGQ